MTHLSIKALLLYFLHLICSHCI